MSLAASADLPSALPVIVTTSCHEPAHGVSQDEVNSGEYPLSRFLYIYINRAPNQPLDPLVREFIEYVCSKQGQEVVVKDGYLPLNQRLCGGELAKIQ